FQTTGQALLIKWADAEGRKEYLPSTVVFWTEVVKLFTSLILVFHDSGDLFVGGKSIAEHLTQSPIELGKAAVPSLVYTVQNNLMFYSLTKLSAPVQQVLYQMKIITTAGLGVLMLGKSLGAVKWSACFLLAFGIMVVQVSRNAQSTTSGSLIEWDLWEGLENDQMKGFGAVLCACLTSGFAGVWIQKMLQQTQASIWMRNVQLGLFGACNSLVVAVAQDGEIIMNRGFHTGYNIRVLLVIGMNAFGGLLCAVMLKYAGATHGCFSTALSIILTCIMSSIVLHDFTPDFLFVVGTAISVGASFLFALGLPKSCSVAL
ncbi:Slc35a3, partial [Symbiodinium pilosum]